jgi:predicted metal-binding membrane protein
MQTGGLQAEASARGLFLPVLAGLVALAWLTLLLWAQGPYGRYLDHGQWTEIGLAGELCRALPAGPIVLPAVLYVGGWVLMTAAMMLPTTLPLLARFERLTEREPRRAWLSALLVGGYLAVWGAFGSAAHLLDTGLHALVAATPWLMRNGWIVGAGILAASGAFQFSALKYRCLDQCRTPFSFLNAHWRGRAPGREALALGVHHGIFCVGCCWAIMLLMFVVGTGSVGWMLLIGAAMAAEKTMPWGRRLSTPLGIGLLAWSGAVIAGHASGWLA